MIKKISDRKEQKTVKGNESSNPVLILIVVDNGLVLFYNISQGPKNANFYLIYKISTLEDSNIDDSLLMSIYYNIDEEKIILD